MSGSDGRVVRAAERFGPDDVAGHDEHQREGEAISGEEPHCWQEDVGKDSAGDDASDDDTGASTDFH